MSLATIILGLFQAVMLTAVGFVLVVMLLKQKNNQLYRLMLIISFCVMIQNAAYLLELRSISAAEALVSIRIYFVGGTYVSMLFLFMTLVYCGYKIPRKLFTAISIFNGFVVFSIWTCEVNPLYYTSFSFDADAALPHAVMGKGILYFLYAIVNALQLVACIVVSALSIRRVKDSRQKRNINLLICSTLSPLICSIIGTWDVLGGYNPVPVGTGLGVILFTFAIVYQHAFDLVEIAHKSIVQTMGEALLIVDYHYGYIEANDEAMSKFPQLSDYPKGTNMKESEFSYLFQSMDDSELVIEGSTYHIHRNTIMDGDILSGYAILLFDITQERLQFERMQKLKEEADIANHAKSTFLANISHEIRTPINAIFGMNEMILRQSHEITTKKYAFDVKNAVKTLLSIINDILDSSKIESGKMEIVPAEYELEQLLNDVYNMISIKAQDKHLSMMFDVSPELPSVLWGDDIRIRQILLNIMSNAVKYTSEGAVSLHVTGEVRDDEAFLRFSVKDTGIGIHKEDLSRLFEAFERVDIEKNRKIEGTGLGMNISAALLKLMNSKIEVESEYGKGSQFSFVLVQKVINHQPIGEFDQGGKQLSEEYHYTVSFTAPAAKVLVVDDNQLNRTIFKGLLKDTLIQISEADSGFSCLDMVKREKYDLIFMDDMMPDMDGRETLESMQKISVYPCKDTPVVMLTANAVLGAREKYLKLAFADFLTKPIEPAKLEAMVGQMLPTKYVSWKQADQQAADIMNTDRETDLPEIEGVDWEYAGLHLPNEALLRETALQFLKSMPGEIQILQELIDSIEEADSLTQYRIHVHTIKGTAAMLGIVSLSGLAAISERAARNNDIEGIRTLHIALADELKLYQKRLVALQKTDQEKEAADLLVVLPLTDMLRIALIEHDYEASDELIAQITKYIYEDELQKLVNLLQEQVLNMEAVRASETAEKLVEKIRGKLL